MRMKMTKFALTQFLIVAILLNASYSRSNDLVKGKSHTIYASWLYSSETFLDINSYLSIIS